MNYIKTDEYILCAAIHYDNNKEYPEQPLNIKTGFVITGRRHNNCYFTFLIISAYSITPTITEGFITNTNKFLDRAEAYKVAVQAGQIKSRDKHQILISEDLYYGND